MHKIDIARIYEEQELGKGLRILVDRLWPRGISKERAQIDYWLKDIAPSTQLRKWFHSQNQAFDEFVEQYMSELNANQPAVNQLKGLVEKSDVVLLYGTKHKEQNHALVLREYIQNQMK